MIIEMTIPERIHTMGILPDEGNFLTLRVTRELKAKLGFSAEEISNYNIKNEDNIVTWNSEGNTPVPIEFLNSELDIIKRILIQMDTENKLTMNLFTVYEKVI